jgi:Zn-dependent protease with chaperone function
VLSLQRIVCGSCSSGLKAPPTLAGKSVKCPKCGDLVHVPPLLEHGGDLYRLAGATVEPYQETSNTASTSQSKSPVAKTKKPAGPPKPLSKEVVKARLDEVLAGFKGEFNRPRRGVGYRMLELVVLGLVLLLPVIYVGMIVGVSWLLYWHAVNNLWMMGGHGRAIILGLFIYGAILVGGGAVLFAMILPLFGSGGEQEAPRRSLTPTGEPILFELVDHLCDTLKAPRPSRIDVNIEVNATASFNRGLLSFFGSDVVLTIGLPLVAGLSAKQLIGILAHEFGHFTQGFSSRLQFTIGSILRWFLHAASASHGLGSGFHVETPQSSEGCLVAFAAWIVRSCLWIGRQSLFLCFLLGYLASLALLRRREYDADAYEYGLVGTKSFESTFRSMHLLNEGWQAGIRSAISMAPTFRGMPEDIPQFAATLAADPSDSMLRAGKKARRGKTGLFDTHPSDKDRIAAGRASGAKGVFDSDLPASALFTNFPALCRNATFDFYRQVFSPTIKPDYLIPNEGVLELGRRFAGCVAPPSKTF